MDDRYCLPGIDPPPEIGAICAEYGIWLHIDAAYADSAAVCPELRWSYAGLEYADSYCVDPHKWLPTGFDCDAFWLAVRRDGCSPAAPPRRSWSCGGQQKPRKSTSRAPQLHDRRPTLPPLRDLALSVPTQGAFLPTSTTEGARSARVGCSSR
ncbi:pyridoxal-dependent decarboxylase [Micromonospora sp. WMMD710]|uniref:pyridoxal-dependent decarboxylase n=1 Tax=Micromonospora sp. WMMD710 TaxID=3016085 RepID=UPI0032420120